MSRRAAVLGHPISHSLSPMIHTHWLGKYGIDGHYEAIDTAPETLGGTLKRLVAEGYAGFNATLPHKQAVMDHCDTLDAVASAIGAVNTVIIRDGKFHGTNTDAFGFMANLKEQFPQWLGSEGPALVLGAGGAAKAILYALQQEGVPEIILTNRTQGRAQHLAAGEKHITVMPWQQRHDAAKNARLIVNTTSLGMTGQGTLEMDLSETDAVVYDIVYKPLMTDLLLQAEKNQLPVVTGLGMLLHQARPAFERWFGVLPDVDSDLMNKVTKAAGGQ